MKILLYDDEEIQLSALEALLRNYTQEIQCSSSGEALLKENNVVDIAFLDIEAQDVSGLEIARHLKNNNPDCMIVFFTNHSEYALKGYQVRAFDYILKTEPEQCIRRRVEEAIAEYNNAHNIVAVLGEDTLSHVMIKDILYVESVGHMITVHTKEKNYDWKNETLRNIEHKLKAYGLLRCHRSFIVNLSWIQSIIKKKELVLHNQIRLPLGRMYKDRVWDSYMRRANIL